MGSDTCYWFEEQSVNSSNGMLFCLKFVEGRLANCQTLVGIAIGNEAVAGAVGIPFPAGNLTKDSTIVYGLADVGTGVIGSPLTRGPFPLDHHIDGIKYPRPHIATSDAQVPVMQACREAAIKRFGGSNVIYGGAGNKILAASLGEVDASIQHKVGGAWDLCAPHAILKAMGGRMTDLWGEEIAIYGPDAPPHCNERGYIATPQTTNINCHCLHSCDVFFSVNGRPLNMAMGQWALRWYQLQRRC